MSKIFYDHLIIIEEVTLVLDKHKLDKKEKQQILSYIDETLHHHILDTILTHLPATHHKNFLTEFHQKPYDIKLLNFLITNIDIDIEKEIIKTADKVKKEILEMIKKSKD